MAVEVDEAGADDLAGRINVAGPRSPASPADGDDPSPWIPTSAGYGGLPDPLATQPPRINTSSKLLLLLLRRGRVPDVRAEPRIEDVPQPVAEEVEAQHDHHDREGPGRSTATR